MTYAYTPGPGDQITWGRCAGHPMDPRTPEYDEERISREDAPGIAADLLRSTPALWSAWLQTECSQDSDPLCWVQLTRALRKGERRLSVPELLTLLVCGYEADLHQVRYQLVEHFDAVHREVAEADADKMLREQDRQKELDLLMMGAA